MTSRLPKRVLDRLDVSVLERWRSEATGSDKPNGRLVIKPTTQPRPKGRSVGKRHSMPFAPVEA
jgi:hypothetical protein